MEYMKTKKYSKGVFLNAVPRDRKYWRKQANFINSLLGVEHVEVLIEENLDLSEIRFIKSLLKEYKVITHAPFIEVNPISCHPEIREVALKLHLKAIEVSRRLDAEVMTIHGGKMNIFQSKETVMKLLVQNLTKIKKYHKRRPNIAIENLPSHSGIFGDFLSELEDFSYLKKSFPEANFTLDIGHAFRSGENLTKISKFLKQYKNSILDIHLHDAIFRGRDHLALGEGDLDFNKLFHILNKIGYAGYITLETISQEDTRKSWQKIYKL